MERDGRAGRRRVRLRLLLLQQLGRRPQPVSRRDPVVLQRVRRRETRGGVPSEEVLEEVLGGGVHRVRLGARIDGCMCGCGNVRSMRAYVRKGIAIGVIRQRGKCELVFPNFVRNASTR